MALGNLYKTQQFLFTQFLSILIAIIFIATQYFQGYNIRYFLYCSPVILLLMILYYYSFWRGQVQQLRCFALVNLILLLCSGSCFFGIYYGVFNKTLSYTLQEAQNCEIVGTMTTSINGGEYYSILYVNFEKDGINMMGYGCKSNLYEADLFQRINPMDFYFHNSKIPCQSETSNRLLRENNINLNSELTEQVTGINLNQNKRMLAEGECVDYYTFSEVKLPSWMCLPNDTSYEELIKKKRCYISSYKNNQYGSKDKPYQNAQERKPLKKISSFVIVEFDDLAVPLKYLVPLIIFTFYPFIISTNLPMIFITQLMIELYLRCKFFRAEKQIDQNLIMQQNSKEDKSETILQKQISLQSPTTLPSRVQNDDKNNQTSLELKTSKVENSVRDSQFKMQSLSEEEVKKIKLKYMQRHEKPSKNEDDKKINDVSKESNRNDEITTPQQGKLNEESKNEENNNVEEIIIQDEEDQSKNVSPIKSQNKQNQNLLSPSSSKQSKYVNQTEALLESYNDQIKQKQKNINESENETE